MDVVKKEAKKKNKQKFKKKNQILSVLSSVEDVVPEDANHCFKMLNKTIVILNYAFVVSLSPGNIISLRSEYGNYNLTFVLISVLQTLCTSNVPVLSIRMS